MNAVVKQSQDLAPAAEGATLLAVISRAAADPATDVTKMERLMAMYERIEAKNAEQQFNEAMNAAQAQIGRIATDKTNSQTHSEYATYAALDRVLRPIYTESGFSLSFDTGEAPDGYVRVLCYVSHKGGHTRTYRADIPSDGKGAKGNDVMTKTHAVGSGMQYGQRYLLKLIFNVAIGKDKDDDDGNRASANDGAIADPLYDKIDLAETIDELRKVRPELESAKVQGSTKRNLIAHYNAKSKKLKGATP